MQNLNPFGNFAELHLNEQNKIFLEDMNLTEDFFPPRDALTFISNNGIFCLLNTCHIYFLLVEHQSYIMPKQQMW